MVSSDQERVPVLWGVVTINMPRIAYLSKTPEEFYNRLDRLMDISARSLHIKREVIGKLLDEDYILIQRDILEAFPIISLPLDWWE